MEVLADTSVWVHYFRCGFDQFAGALQEKKVWIHPLVIGELATGNLNKRQSTLQKIKELPRLEVSDFFIILKFLEEHHLYGRGIHWNDIQLLMAARLSNIPLWTLDRRLRDAAETMGISYSADPE